MQFERTKLLFENLEYEKIKNFRVLIFGLGGVGGYACYMLARLGVKELGIVDYDKITITNLNRQIVANLSNLGNLKTDEMEKLIINFNNEIIIKKYSYKIDENTINNIDFKNYDYIIDCIDDFKAKIKIIEKCKELNIKIISAMGAGNKITTNYIISDISKTEVCPLARKIRLELKKLGIKKLNVAYSKDKIIKIENNIGSVIFSVMSMACKIIEFVIKDLTEVDDGKNKEFI